MIREHCVFAWVEPQDPGEVREYRIEAEHCPRCIEELRRLMPSAKIVRASGVSPRVVASDAVASGEATTITGRKKARPPR
jgi:hypothetical protein